MAGQQPDPTRVTGTAPIVSVVGRSDSGKTTFLEKLIRELTARGIRVATVKHHVHDYDVDVPGKDSWRHARAGSVTAMVSSPDKFSLVSRVDHEMTLDELARVAFDSGAELLITEGFKREGHNRVEIIRRERSTESICEPGDLFALVTDVPESAPQGVDRFDLDDAPGLADLIASHVLGRGEDA